MKHCTRNNDSRCNLISLFYRKMYLLRQQPERERERDKLDSCLGKEKRKTGKKVQACTTAWPSDRRKGSERTTGRKESDKEKVRRTKNVSGESKTRCTHGTYMYTSSHVLPLSLFLSESCGLSLYLNTFSHADSPHPLLEPIFICQY